MTKAKGLAHGPEPGTQKLETKTPVTILAIITFILEI